MLATDTVIAHVGKNLARRRQGFGVDPFVGIPQVGSDNGAGALKINLASTVMMMTVRGAVPSTSNEASKSG
jgi:hypothetical protein